jgi:hypothetical protein
MKRIAVAGLLALALGIMLSACSIVTIRHPVGEPVSDDVGKEVEGLWSLESGEDPDDPYAHYCYVKYLKDGAFRVAQLLWEEEKFRLYEWTGLLTKHDKALYLNVRANETKTEAPPAYYVLRMQGGSSRIMVLWVPRFSAFADAVQSGQLAGQQTKDEVTITASKADLEAFLKARSAGDLFMLEVPLVLVRQ